MYRVLWLQSALDELATAWMQADAPLRHSITLAAHNLEQELRNDPASKGESREEERRVLFVPPIGITFEVVAEQHLVRIWHVWVFRRPRS